ncbi:collagen alpha-2(V) chain-like [Tigriopus californicus]|uniref:collagen alpha-2(V) chain-like n=1 Tax=Tigriopus californicus TaxID=6832 RepID=UPI0027D9CF6A|nr:collagen alpha-2(V) chain-like [Tigriopus californicus]
MNPIVSILIGALILARIDGEPSMGNNGGFTLPKGGIKSDIPNQVLKPFATDMVTQGVAVALLAGLGVLSGGAALSALSAQSQLQKLQGNFRTVCNAVRAAGAVDGGAIPIGPPGPPGPVGPPGPAGMDGTCSAAGDDCAEVQADINDVIARLNAVSVLQDPRDQSAPLVPQEWTGLAVPQEAIALKSKPTLMTLLHD